MSKKEVNSFRFHKAFAAQLALLTGKQCAELTRMAVAYMNGEEPKTDDAKLDMAFSSWQLYLDKDKELSEMRSLAGKKAAKARWNKQESEV